MNTTRNKFGENLYIIWAIATKDVIEAVKNRTILANIVLLPMMIVLYKWLPTLYDPDDIRVVVYDAGQSQLVTRLENDLQFDLYKVYSHQQMAERLDAMPMAVLGLFVPVGFDQALDAGQSPALDGYVMHWVSCDKASELQTLFEKQFAEWAGHPVTIHLEGNVIYSLPDSMGPVRGAAISIAVVILFSGLTVVPLLIIEEKQAKTLDAMLISPANSSQIVVGKVLVGVFYGLATIGVALLVNQAMVVQWGLTILTALIGLSLSVAIDLVMGVFFERKQQVSSWGMGIFTVILAPVFLNGMEPILPQALRAVFDWVPTVALAKVFRFSFSRGATPLQIAANLGLAVGSFLLIFAIIVYKIYRSDR